MNNILNHCPTFLTDSFSYLLTINCPWVPWDDVVKDFLKIEEQNVIKMPADTLKKTRLVRQGFLSITNYIDFVGADVQVTSL